MRKMYKILLILFLCFCSSNLLIAQNAFFTIGDDEGCGILVVQFTNGSTGTGELSYSWDFGNGSESIDTHPQITYTSPGTYTITLEVSDDNGVDTYTDQVIVHPYPVVNFSANPTGGCAPVTTIFTDASSQSGSNIQSWNWNFGDGSSGTGSSIEHTYNNSGSYSVILTVEDGFGCTKTETYDNYINVSQPPTVSFTANPSTHCAPTTVQFTNNSFGSAEPLSYSWDFGDGSTSTQMNPSHFFELGYHQIHLTVTDNANCSNSSQGTVHINELNPNIHVNKTDLCIGEGLSFSNTDGGGNHWNFGDGSESNFNTPYHSFSEAGTYTVVLTVGTGICLTTDNIEITVHPDPVIAYSTLPEYLCDPDTLVFLNETTYGSTYEWNIYEDTYHDTSLKFTSFDVNPEFFTEFERLYIYEIEAVSEYGCYSILVDSTDVVFPDVYFIAQEPLEFCVPFTTTLVPYISTLDPVIDYSWSYEGSFYSGDSIPPNLTITEPAIYEATLIIETEHGCIDTIIREILAGTIPETSFYTIEDSVCRGGAVQYVNTSPDSLLIDDYQWFWNDNNPMAGTDSLLIAPDHVGYVTVTLEASYNDCENTFITDSSFYVMGPLLNDLEIDFECDNIFDRNFELVVLDTDSMYWDFGDDTDSIWYATNMQHIYENEGFYILEIVAHSEITGCENDTLWATVSVFNPKVNVFAPEFSCPEISMSIMPTATVRDFYILWDDEIDGTYGWEAVQDISNPYEHTYSSGGTKEIKVIGMDSYGCLDTTSVFVEIAYADIDFTVPASACVGEVVQLFPEFDSNLPIVEYIWDLGPGGTLTFTDESILEYIFEEGQVYDIQIFAEDTAGCEYESPTHYLQAHAIDLVPFIDNYNICKGDELIIVGIDDSEFEELYADYGDASVIDSSVSHVYEAAGSYNISLFFIDEFGCDSTFYLNGISVQEAILDIVLEDEVLDCYPDSPVFIDLDGESPFGLEYAWSDNTGNTSDAHIPEFIYTDRGSYSISVTAVTTNGCEDSMVLDLMIEGPYADVNVSDDVVCKNDTIKFWMSNAENIVSYNWTLGDGFGIANTNPVEHSFLFVPEDRYFEIVLSYPAEGCDADGDGQNDIYTSIDSVRIYPVVADFDLYNTETNLLDTNACSPLFLRFENTSKSIEGIENRYRWEVNNEWVGISTNIDEFEISNNNSLYDTTEIALYVSSEYECKDTAYQKVIVRSIPELTLSEDKEICLGENVDLWATGEKTIEWESDVFIENPDSFLINIEPEESTTVYATLTSENECQNEGSIYVFVQQIPELYTNYSDTLVVVGQEFNLFSGSNQEGVTYSWTPPLGLSCTNCPNPEIKITEAQEYQIEIKDSLECHSVFAKLYVDVFYGYTLDMPNSFTPNGDGENDEILVRGWGLKDLIEFKIYNRWGEQIFFSNDLKVGWDGTYKGKPQNIDSYAYFVKVLTFNNDVLTKKGTITLLR